MKNPVNQSERKARENGHAPRLPARGKRRASVSRLVFAFYFWLVVLFTFIWCEMEYILILRLRKTVCRWKIKYDALKSRTLITWSWSFLVLLLFFFSKELLPRQLERVRLCNRLGKFVGLRPRPDPGKRIERNRTSSPLPREVQFPFYYI